MHPTSDLIAYGQAGGNAASRIIERAASGILHIPGGIERGRAEAIEETIWGRLHFARHLRPARLGEFTIGTELHRSESLALIQLLILYHLFTATATRRARRRGRAPRQWRPRRRITHYLTRTYTRAITLM